MQVIVDRPGRFGIKREKRVEFYDNMFGHEHWSECWQVGSRVLNFLQAVELYDQSYHQFLAENPDIVQSIIQYGECYGYNPENVKAGCQHDQFACPRHIQDVSVRRALKLLGVWFLGPADHLLEIRGEDSNGAVLMPGRVPFIYPELILPDGRGGPVPEYVMPGSCEDFWQSNKCIVLE